LLLPSVPFSSAIEVDGERVSVKQTFLEPNSEATPLKTGKGVQKRCLMTQLNTKSVSRPIGDSHVLHRRHGLHPDIRVARAHPPQDQQAQQPTKQPATNGSVKDRGGAPQGQKQKQRGQARKCIDGVWINCLRPTACDQLLDNRINATPL